MPAESPARAVEAWMRAVGHPVASHPQDFVPADMTALMVTLLREESAEAIEAIASGDLPHIAQELSDVIVVAHCAAAVFGLDLDRALDEVMRANNSKLVDGKAVRRADGKVGMGFLHYDPHDVKGSDLGHIDVSRGLDFDYVQGRMMKLSIRRESDGTYSAPDAAPRSDYQSWARRYPTYRALIEAAGICLDAAA